MSSPAPRVSRYPRAAATPPPSFTSPYLDTSASELLSSPDHSERCHERKLATAKARHDLIRSKADHVLRLHEEQKANEDLLEQTRLTTERLRLVEENGRLSREQTEREQRRLRAEEAAREEERKARDLSAKTVPPLSPVRQPVQWPQAVKPATVPTPTPQPAPTTLPTTKTTAHNTVATTPVAGSTAPATSTPAPAPTTATAAVTKPAPVVESVADTRKSRALAIHKNLKELRKNVEAQTGSNRALKGCAGDLRRELRKCVGQLSLDKKGNSAITTKVTNVLKEGLANSSGSLLLDPSHFVFDDRQSLGPTHNPQLPSLFLFLVNHLAKCVVKQFINECAANTKTADPIGVLVASVFSDPMFHWCGKPLIDILIAKFHVVCPVLFGARGLEKTDQGKDSIGWLRREGIFIEDTEHYNRQMGLAAGFAAITLRDFSRSKKTNPYPMHHYWEAFAHVVNTGLAEISDTQCVVLKAMIEHYEQRFLLFYGTAAIAALRLALVEFPANAKSAGFSNPGIESLAVHAKTLRSKYGLVLA